MQIYHQTHQLASYDFHIRGSCFVMSLYEYAFAICDRGICITLKDAIDTDLTT